MPVVGSSGEANRQVHALAKRRIACSNRRGRREMVLVGVTYHRCLLLGPAAAPGTHRIVGVRNQEVGVLAWWLASRWLDDTRLQQLQSIWLLAGVVQNFTTSKRAFILGSVIQVHFRFLIVQHVHVLIIVFQQVVNLGEGWTPYRKVWVRIGRVVFLVLGELVDRLAVDNVVAVAVSVVVRLLVGVLW